MLKGKMGASMISLILCAIAVTLVTAALVIANYNSAIFKAQQIANKNKAQFEISAYSKIYTKAEIEIIARQAFVDNYLSFYDKNVDFEGFEALIMGEIMRQVPVDQLEEYNIHVLTDGVIVEQRG